MFPIPLELLATAMGGHDVPMRRCWPQPLRRDNQRNDRQRKASKFLGIQLDWPIGDEPLCSQFSRLYKHSRRHEQLFRWTLTADGEYTTKSTYTLQLKGCTRSTMIDSVWHARAPPKQVYGTPGLPQNTSCSRGSCPEIVFGVPTDCSDANGQTTTFAPYAWEAWKLRNISSWNVHGQHKYGQRWQ
jgi:hypothetical protein